LSTITPGEGQGCGGIPDWIPWASENQLPLSSTRCRERRMSRQDRVRTAALSDWRAPVTGIRAGCCTTWDIQRLSLSAVYDKCDRITYNRIKRFLDDQNKKNTEPCVRTTRMGHISAISGLGYRGLCYLAYWQLVHVRLSLVCVIVTGRRWKVMIFSCCVVVKLTIQFFLY